MPAPIINQILALLANFLTLDMDQADILRIVGSGTGSGDAGQILVRPTRWPADSVTLLSGTMVNGQDFVTEIEFSWDAPQNMMLADLEKAFGSGRLLSGRRPGAPDRYLFNLKGFMLPGTLIVTVAPKSYGKDRVEVSRIKIIRHPPELLPAENARAARIVIFAELGSTYSAGAGMPGSWAVSRHSGLDELFAQFRPGVHFEVADHIGRGAAPLHLAFRPTSLSDFAPDRVLLSIPETAGAANLRLLLADILAGGQPAAAINDGIEVSELPPWLGQTIEALASGDRDQISTVVGEIDRALSAQLTAIYSNDRIRSFAAAWLGLGLLVENFDPADHSVLEVYSITPENLAEQIDGDFFTRESRHPSGAPPVLALIDGGFLSDHRYAKSLAQAMTAIERLAIPLAIDLPSATLDQIKRQVSGDQTIGPSLILARQKLLSLPSLGASGSGPGTIDFQTTDDTAIWSSGAWLFAAAAAGSQSRQGRPDIPETVSTPERFANPRKRPAALLQAAEPGGAGALQAVFALDAQEGHFKLADPLADTEQGESFGQLIFRASLFNTVRRIRYGLPKRTSTKEIVERFETSLKDRFPDAEIVVTSRGGEKAGGKRSFQIQVDASLEGESRTGTIEIRWD